MRKMKVAFCVCLLILALSCRLSVAYDTYSSYGRAIEVKPRGYAQTYPNSNYGNHGTYGTEHGNAPAEIDVHIVDNTVRRNRRMTDDVQPNVIRS